MIGSLLRLAETLIKINGLESYTICDDHAVLALDCFVCHGFCKINREEH